MLDFEESYSNSFSNYDPYKGNSVKSNRFSNESYLSSLTHPQPINNNDTTKSYVLKTHTETGKVVYVRLTPGEFAERERIAKENAAIEKLDDKVAQDLIVLESSISDLNKTLDELLKNWMRKTKPTQDQIDSINQLFESNIKANNSSFSKELDEKKLKVSDRVSKLNKCWEISQKRKNWLLKTILKQVMSKTFYNPERDCKE